MDEERLILGLGLLASLSTVALMVAAFAWRRAALRAQQFQDHLLQGGRVPLPAEVDALVNRLDALSQRVDQLTEGHHFLCRLLSKQRSVSLPSNAAVSPVPTPH